MAETAPINANLSYKTLNSTVEYRFGYAENLLCNGKTQQQLTFFVTVVKQSSLKMFRCCYSLVMVFQKVFLEDLTESNCFQASDSWFHCCIIDTANVFPPSVIFWNIGQIKQFIFACLVHRYDYVQSI